MIDVKEKVKNYIKSKGRTTIPEIQMASGLSYKVVHEAILILCEEGKVYLSDGLHYEIQPEKTIFQSMSEHQRRWQDFRDVLLREDDDDEDDDEGEMIDESNNYDRVYKEALEQRKQYLERKRRELIERMRGINAQTSEQEEITEVCENISESIQDNKRQEENIEKADEIPNNADAVETVSENSNGIPALINTLEELNPMCKLAGTLNAVNPAQRLINDLNAINPLSRLTNVLSGIASKKDYEQSELFAARRRLLVVLKNIAVAQDDKLRNNGKSYSEEYFGSFDRTISMCQVSESKYEIKADNVYLLYGYEYKVYLIYVGNNTYLSDEGLLYEILSQRIGSSRATRKIERCIGRKCLFKYNDGVLLMDTSKHNAINDYFIMYYAMCSLIKKF